VVAALSVPLCVPQRETLRATSSARSMCPPGWRRPPFHRNASTAPSCKDHCGFVRICAILLSGYVAYRARLSGITCFSFPSLVGLFAARTQVVRKRTNPRELRSDTARRNTYRTEKPRPPGTGPVDVLAGRLPGAVSKPTSRPVARKGWLLASRDNNGHIVSPRVLAFEACVIEAGVKSAKSPQEKHCRSCLRACEKVQPVPGRNL